MDNKKRLMKQSQIWGVGFILLFFIIIMMGYGIVLFSRFKENSKELRTRYVEEQKTIIQNQVNSAIDRINHKKAKDEQIAKEQVKQEVERAYLIADNIYNKYKKTRNQSEIIKMIMEALRPIRFNNGNGYIFSNNLSGKILLYPTMPALENSNMLNLKDSKGVHAVLEQNKICKEKREGFVTGYWAKPDFDSQKGFKKISFIKYFRPYDLYFGAGIYVNDVKEILKDELLSQLIHIRFGQKEKGYLFGSTFMGDSLFSNGKRTKGSNNIWNLTDPNGVKIIQDQREMAKKPEGGFVYYSWEKLSTQKISPKVSFVKAVNDWEWMIGAGFYLDDIEIEITKLQMQLRRKAFISLSMLLLLTLIASIFFLLIFRFMKNKIKKDYTQFESFLKNAAFSNDLIDIRKLQYGEFCDLAKIANKLLENLRESEGEYKNIIDNMVDGYYRCDKDGKIILISHSVVKILGFSEDEIIGKNARFFYANIENKKQFLNKIKETGIVENFIAEFKTKNSGNIFIETNSRLYYDTNGDYAGIEGTFRDITERKKTEEQLLKFHTAIEQSPSFIVITDLKGNVEYINPKFTQLTGYSFDEAKTVNTKILKAGTLSEGFYKDLWKTISSGKKWRGEFHNKKKNGELFWESSSISPIFDSENRIINYLKVGEDITEKKKNEIELQKMEKLQSIGVLAGGIAHDFNNILTILYGNVSLAIMKLAKDHPSYEYLTKTEKSMGRATKLTQQLLTFSKGGSPSKKYADLLKIIKDTVTFDLSGSNLKPHFKFANNLFNAKVDEAQMEQVFSNLTINADQATPESGNLFIVVENTVIKENHIPYLAPGNYLKIIIKDEGIGIPKENIDKIFDPYFTTKKAGIGLGLATTYSIIKKHNGYVKIESNIDKGTTFIIYLPASKSQIVEEKEDRKTKKSPKVQSKRILVMDDEDAICVMASEMLESLGYTTDTASNGDEAILKYKGSLEKKKPFDAIIMDLTIPGGMGGKETIKHILNINPNAKVIVSSGYASNSSIATYQKLGFKGKIDKPYTLIELKKILQQVLKSKI